MKFGPFLSFAFILVLGVSLFSNSADLVGLLLTNAALQLVLFILVACIPFLRTGRMSFVDIAWPFGVALIGAQILLFAEGDALRKTIVGAVYLFIGLRMGIGAVVMGMKTGVIFKSEFPRYQYSRMILEKAGSKNVKIHMLSEMMTQGFANMSVLALPGFIIATNPNHVISIWEVFGMGIWAIAYLFETIADAQKLLFISRNEEGVCNIGLWKYSRHPNYFSEWLVWTGLVIATLPSWWALKHTETFAVWIVLGIGTLLASVMLYITLVYLTGVKPSEYYSARKRVGYKAYQKTTSMFFPWFPKK